MCKDVMLNRTTLILAASWAFLVGPTLCRAGLLTHACEQHASDCGHESDCEYDPCAKHTSVGVSTVRADWLDSLNQPLAVTVLDALVSDPMLTRALIGNAEPPHQSLPAPGDRLPLRI